ncbi:hypothetical protein M0R72_18605 [Candidatus Pacearchaeota archaeon]|jgi:hypothetical protein|nr:hypothetical protein [Candidatus Pacearchaeota archaeon]
MSDISSEVFIEAEELGFDFEEGARFLLDAFESTGIGSGTLENGVLTLHTGGWSDCETLLDRCSEFSLWWQRWWYSTQRGGHYVFGDPETIEKPEAKPDAGKGE